MTWIYSKMHVTEIQHLRKQNPTSSENDVLSQTPLIRTASLFEISSSALYR